MKIKPLTALLATVIIAATGILLTSTTGLWSTESAKTPAKFENGGALEGQYRADDIRGSYTFGEISNLFHIPLEHLAKAFGVSTTEAEAFQCKNLETLFLDSPEEIGTGSVRMFVAFYIGQPMDLSESTYVTQSGAEIINTLGKPLEEQRKYLESHVIPTNLSEQPVQSQVPSAPTTEQAQAPSAPPKEQPSDGTVDVMGSTYIKDLSTTYDVPLEDIAEAFLLSKLEAEKFQVKDVKNKFANTDIEIGTASIKLFIAFYKGIPYDISQTEAFLTSKGAEIIKTKGTPLEAQLDYLNTHTMRE